MRSRGARGERPDPSIIPEKLADLKAANLPHVNWRDFIKVVDEPLTPEQEAALDKHFQMFVEWQKDGNAQICVCCRKKFGIDSLSYALLLDVSETRLEWDLAHGECHCTTCGWPARQLHYDLGGSEPVITRLSMAFQYHPDGITIPDDYYREDASDEADD